MYLPMRKNNAAVSLYKFIKLPLQKKLDAIEAGILLDTDEEKERITLLYFLNGFFIEKVISTKTGSVIEVIPFKNGYRVNQFNNWLHKIKMK
jgi:hypothetical protein